MIRIEKLCKAYDDFLAVDHLSFEVAEGEILGLVGPFSLWVQARISRFNINYMKVMDLYLC